MDILSTIKNVPKSYFVYFVIICVLLSAIIYVYKQYVAPKMDPAYSDNNEFVNEGGEGGEAGEEGSSGYAEMIMFYVDWCPHCKTSLPMYDEFAEKYNNKSINGYKLKVVKMNCTDDEDPSVKSALEKYNIEGYPTITLSKNGDLTTFDAQPDVETLEKFIDQVLKE
tara:strand:+ start:556 stop:1056 length:501 start_codon:yes stop_codon:yes gene_type:complete